MRVSDYDSRKESESINQMLIRRNSDFKQLQRDFFKEHDSLEVLKNEEDEDGDVFD